VTAPDRGLLVVVAGPSGVGKGTVLRCVLERLPDAELSISATTRPPRPGELDGHDYHFLSAVEFDDLTATGGFLEWAEYLGNRYGTPRRAVDERIAAGHVVILEIEVQGAEQIRDLEREALLVFLAPPSLDELARRLRSRGTESPEHIDRRLAIAAAELEERHWFDHVVVNDDVDRACAEIVAIIRAARAASEMGG
jgi:guanylate kinase